VDKRKPALQAESVCISKGIALFTKMPLSDNRSMQMKRRLALVVLALTAMLGGGQLASAADGAALVFGANGKLGSEMVKVLVARNMDVTAFVRPTADRSLLAGLKINYVEGDARNKADIDKAFASGKFTLAVNAIARRSRTEFGLYDASQNNITAAAKATGVKQMIFFSSVGVGSSRSLYTDKAYANFKETMLEREAAEKTLITSGVNYTIVRTGGVLDGKETTGKAYLSEKPILGATTRADLALITVACVGADFCKNKIFHAVDDTQKVPGE
jgi:uncharacterized protein YbjT (DUF2867 family)